jgi:hypothetical protein
MFFKLQSFLQSIFIVVLGILNIRLIDRILEMHLNIKSNITVLGLLNERCLKIANKIDLLTIKIDQLNLGIAKLSSDFRFVSLVAFIMLFFFVPWMFSTQFRLAALLKEKAHFIFL